MLLSVAAPSMTSRNWANAFTACSALLLCQGIPSYSRNVKSLFHCSVQLIPVRPGASWGLRFFDTRRHARRSTGQARARAIQGLSTVIGWVHLCISMPLNTNEQR